MNCHLKFFNKEGELMEERDWESYKMKDYERTVEEYNEEKFKRFCDILKNEPKYHSNLTIVATNEYLKSKGWIIDED